MHSDPQLYNRIQVFQTFYVSSKGTVYARGRSCKMGGWRRKKSSKAIIARDNRIISLVADYENREPLVFLKGIAYNFEF